jgi:hypothetical protein
MAVLAIAAGVLLLFLVLLLWRQRRHARTGGADRSADWLDTVAAWPPTATRVLGKNEVAAYKALVRALPGHMVLAKVPLARFVKVPSRHSYSQWLRRLGYQCADLVVCDMASEVVAVVHLSRPDAEMSERAMKRHQRMARVMKAAGIPLHDWPEDALPTAETIRARVLPTSPAAAGSDRTGAAFDGGVDDAPTTEPMEPREPPPSTWFDEFNTGPAPLDAGVKVEPISIR